MYKFLTILTTIILSFVNGTIKSYGWGFSKNDDHLQPYIGKYSEEIKDTNSYYVGNPDEKVVYLTFDAGYDNGNLVKILDVLKEKNVQGTFFITGDFLNRFSDLVVKINDDGHIIGNHTWSHKNITSLNDEKITFPYVVTSDLTLYASFIQNEYIPEVKKGDIRALTLGDKILPYCIKKLPGKGDFKFNGKYTLIDFLELFVLILVH